MLGDVLSEFCHKNGLHTSNFFLEPMNVGHSLLICAYSQTGQLSVPQLAHIHIGKKVVTMQGQFWNKKCPAFFHKDCINVSDAIYDRT